MCSLATRLLDVKPLYATYFSLLDQYSNNYIGQIDSEHQACMRTKLIRITIDDKKCSVKNQENKAVRIYTDSRELLLYLSYIIT